jgi:hypothetical protein
MKHFFKCPTLYEHLPRPCPIFVSRNYGQPNQYRPEWNFLDQIQYNIQLEFVYSFCKKHVDGQMNWLSHHKFMSFISCIGCIRIHSFNSPRFNYSGIWHGIGRVVPHISKECGAFILRVFILLGLFNPEDTGTTLLWNIVNCSPNDTLSCPRRLESSALLLWEPEIWHWIIYFWSHGYICPCHASSCGVSGTSYKLHRYSVIHPLLQYEIAHIRLISVFIGKTWAHSSWGKAF